METVFNGNFNQNLKLCLSQKLMKGSAQERVHFDQNQFNNPLEKLYLTRLSQPQSQQNRN